MHTLGLRERERWGLWELQHWSREGNESDFLLSFAFLHFFTETLKNMECI